MKIHYTCNNCGNYIDSIEVDKLDETKFGFDCLSDQERQDLISVDAAEGVIRVKSVCDKCIENMATFDDAITIRQNYYLH